MIKAWTGAYSEFAVETLFKTDESAIDTHTDFLSHFMFGWDDAVPDRIFDS